MSLMADLQNHEARRSKSARKLIDFILTEPQAVVSMSIATLAASVGVSEPTVNRFCKGLGLKGFPDFKLNLNAELARAEPRIARDIEPGDSTSQVIAKVFEANHASFTRVLNHLDSQAVEQAVSILDKARSIIFCGLGASAPVAIDAQHKFLRFFTPVVAHTEMISQRMITASLTPDDCLVCISYTGRTRALIEVAELAAASGATILGITAPNSPLAKVCTQLLAIEADEDTDLYTPMTSRIAQLTLIDILATSLALRKGDEFDAHLLAVKQRLTNTRQQLE